MGKTADLHLLLALDALRLRGRLRRPRPGAWLLALLPLGILGAWVTLAAGPLPSATDAASGAGVGILVAAVPALAAYPVLFRPADGALLRHLGIPAGAMFLHRALRLLGWSLLPAGVLLLGTGGGRALGQAGVLAGSTAAAWGAGLAATVAAAAALAPAGGGRGRLRHLISWDPALAETAPLVFAPLLPLAAGAAAGAWLAAGVAGWKALGVLGLAALAIPLAAPAFSGALPRFAPRAAEMAFVPRPRAGDLGLVTDRGLARFLPRTAAAVRARDAAVLARRFRWAGRAAWPVAAVGAIAVARGGENSQLRLAIWAAGLAVLLLQGAAVVGVGRLERNGRRWVDRSAGLRWPARLLGRWLAAVGLAAGLVVPLALAWAVWAPPPGGWTWLAAGVGVAAFSATTSLVAAGR